MFLLFANSFHAILSSETSLNQNKLSRRECNNFWEKYGFQNLVLYTETRPLLDLKLYMKWLYRTSVFELLVKLKIELLDY